MPNARVVVESCRYPQLLLSLISRGKMKEERPFNRMFQFKNSMMFPAVLVLSLVILVPLAYSLFISFHDFILQFGLGKWVGWKNYFQAFRREEFLISMKNTFVLTVSVVSLEFVIAMGNWMSFSMLFRNLRIPLADGITVWPPDGLASPAAVA